MKVGFIGLGTMGGNAAKNILRAGFKTVVHDLRPEAATDHLAMGAIWADRQRSVIRGASGPHRENDRISGDHPRCRFRCRRNAGVGSAACARRNGSRRADLSRTIRIAELLLSSGDGLQHLAPQWCAPRKARLSLGELNRSKSSPVYGMRLSDQTVNPET